MNGRKQSLGDWIDRLCATQRDDWLADQRVPVEQYLKHQPALQDDPEGLFCLIYNEFLIREELGETVDPGATDFATATGRFPRSFWK